MALKNITFATNKNAIFAAGKNAVFEKGASASNGRMTGLRVVGLDSRFNARRTGAHK